MNVKISMYQDGAEASTILSTRQPETPPDCQPRQMHLMQLQTDQISISSFWKNMASLLYASFFGGSPAEHVDGGTSRFDKEGTIYQAVCAGCGGSDGFPTTAGAWSEVNGSFNCNLGVGKIAFNLAGVYAESDAEPSINGCAPFTVNFENLSSDAEEYIWDFGDGVGGSVEFEPIYTYHDSSGTYTVMLVVIDSSTCNIADTSYLTVTVYEDSIFADFDLISEQDCKH